MAWASGTTLGEFLEQNYRNPSNLQNLRVSLRSLAKYLESQGMAHGDIQPGNVMVADSGKRYSSLTTTAYLLRSCEHSVAQSWGIGTFSTLNAHQIRGMGRLIDSLSFVLILRSRHLSHSLSSGRERTPTATLFSSRQTTSQIRVSHRLSVI